MPSAVVAAEAVVVAVVVAVERKRGAGVLAPVAVVRKQAAGRTRK